MGLGLCGNGSTVSRSGAADQRSCLCGATTTPVTRCSLQPTRNFLWHTEFCTYSHHPSQPTRGLWKYDVNQLMQYCSFVFTSWSTSTALLWYHVLSWWLLCVSFTIQNGNFCWVASPASSHIHPQHQDSCCTQRILRNSTSTTSKPKGPATLLVTDQEQGITKAIDSVLHGINRILG